MFPSHFTMSFAKGLASFWRDWADVRVVNLFVKPLNFNGNFPHAVWILKLPITICHVCDATAC